VSPRLPLDRLAAWVVPPIRRFVVLTAKVVYTVFVVLALLFMLGLFTLAAYLDSPQPASQPHAHKFYEV